VKQQLNIRRPWIPALILLLSLVMASCMNSSDGGGQTNGNEDGSSGNAAAEESARPAGGDAAAAGNAAAESDALEQKNFALSVKQPFMVFITDRDCCKSLKARMNKLREDQEKRLLFFVIDTRKQEDREAAGKLNVSLELRKNKLPWAGVFNAGAGDTFVKVENYDETKDIEPVSIELQNGVTKARNSMSGKSGDSREATASNGAGGDSGGKSISSQEFAQLLDAHKGEIDRRVNEALQARIDAAVKADAADNPAAPKDNLQTYIEGRSIAVLRNEGVIGPWKTASLIILFGVSLLALAASGMSIWRTRNILDEQPEAATMATKLNERIGALEATQKSLLDRDGVDALLRDRLATVVYEFQLEQLRAEDTKLSKVVNDEKSGLDALNTKVAGLLQREGTAAGDDGQIDSVMALIQDLEKLVKDLEQKVDGFSEDLSGEQADKIDRDSKLDRMSSDVEGFKGSLAALLTKQEADAREAKFDAKFAQLETSLKEATLGTSRALGNALRWLGNMEAARITAGASGNNVERAKTIGKLEAAKQSLRANVNQIGPLSESMKRLAEAVAARPKLPQELKDRLTGFLEDIEKFDRWEMEVGEQIKSLQANSGDSRYQEFLEAQKSLMEKLSSGEISVGDFGEGFSSLFDARFSGEAGNGQPHAPLSEVELDNKLSHIEDHLMDWFSNFSQLVQHVRYSGDPDAIVDDDTLADMIDTHNIAREVLSRFDIQPEEIEIGKTLYDHSMHDLVIARQSSYPARTVIEVQQSGFRRMSDGRTLRSPKVVVAQAGGGELA